MEGHATAAEIIALEKSALDQWGRGDPSGCLELCAPDVTYFDPFIAKRIDGLSALTEYYEGLRGKIKIDRFELIDPRVAFHQGVAILTYNYVSYAGAEKSSWNCSEVFHNLNGRWRIIQTHWSLTQPKRT